MINPITVVKKSKERYLIVAGERRYLACEYLKLQKISCVIFNKKEDLNLSLISLIENIHREDLNIIEQSMYLSQLIEKYNLSHIQAAEKIGKSRSYITNTLRMKNLSSVVKNLVLEKKIESSHARAICSLNHLEQEFLAFEVIKKQLSVRQLEKKVKNLSKKNYLKKSRASSSKENIKDLENIFSEKTQSKVSIVCNKFGKGSIKFSFDSILDFERISSVFLKD